MVGTSFPLSSLPRARALTEAISCPSESFVSRRDLTGLHQRFEQELAVVGAGIATGTRLRVDAYRLSEPISKWFDDASPFRWTPWTARRQVGLESLRTWLADRRRSPAEATDDAITRLIRRAGSEVDREGSLAQWLAGLTTGARSVVQAEATTWTTQFASALDWSSLEHPIVGCDRTTGFQAVPQIRLRGRIEMQTTVRLIQPGMSESSRDVSPTALFTIMTGRPTSTTRVELGLAALTTALDIRRKVTPVRVVGWWPQCGRALVVPVDMRLLEKTCQAVIATVSSLRGTTIDKRPSARVDRARNLSARRRSLPNTLDEERVAS
jgi:hypothetical protein